MKRVLVGTYWLDGISCRLYLREGSDGGEFDTCPKLGETAWIRIAGDYTRLDYTIGILMHEVLEALLATGEHRYEGSNHKSWSADRYLFHFNHAQFAEVAVKAGEFFHDCYPALVKAWHKWHRKPKASKKRKGKK